jgi:hypothetical protein
MGQLLQRLSTGEQVSASAYNALLDAVEPLLSLSADPPIRIHRHPGGMHVSLANLPKLWLFELTAALAVGTTDSQPDDVPSAAADHVHYLRDSNEYDSTDDIGSVTLYDVGVLRDGTNAPIKTPSVGTGDRVWATFNEQSGRWEICPPRPLIRFELDTPLTEGGSATVTELIWTGSDWTAVGATLTVYDALNMFASTSPCRGIAGYWSDSMRWEVIQLDPDCCCSVSSSSSSSAPPQSSSG